MVILVPSFELIGELVEIDVIEPTESHPMPAALALVQFGPERSWSNDMEVNFVNEVYVKMPFHTYSKRIQKFTRGATLRIKGRLQCVQKKDEDVPRIELVAETVSFPTILDSR